MAMSDYANQLSALIAEFNAKKAGIDAAVAAAIAAVPSTQKTFYLDVVAGNDATGDGSSALPWQTIKKAIDSIPSGGIGTINLKVEGTYTLTADITMLNKRAAIVGNRDNKANYIIRPVSYDEGTENKLYGIQMQVGSALQFDGVNIAVPAKANPALPVSATIASVVRLTGLIKSGQGDISFIYSNIDIGADGYNLVRGAGSGGRLQLAHCSALTHSAGYLLSNASLYPFDYFEVSLTLDDTTHRISDIQRDTNAVPVPRNIVSNLIL